MPVTTRRQASSKANANKKTEKKANKKTDRDMVESDVDSWDIPATNLRSSVIKTYSRKQPFRTYWTSSPKNAKSKNTKDSPGMSSKATSTQSSGKPQNAKLSEETLSLTKTTPASNRKLPPRRSSKIPGLTSTMRQTKNVTRLAVESMAACTVLATKPDDVNRSVEDMSLCSVVEAWNKDQENEEIRNSTFLSNRHTINQNFVPSEISVIEEQNKFQDFMVSNLNERSPENKPIQTAATSVKKVRFNVSKKTQKNIFRKTPYRNNNERKCPKTSSPDPNEHLSTLHCDLSTLLIDDDHPNKTKNTSDDQMTQNTEKLIDFEPVPLQCSENIGENPRDITPETCNSVQAQTTSAKRRRRLSYYQNGEEIPACILLDLPVSKTKKKSAVWVGKNPHFVSIEQLESFPDDILKSV